MAGEGCIGLLLAWPRSSFNVRFPPIADVPKMAHVGAMAEHPKKLVRHKPVEKLAE
jgi:hypothetical protein